MSRVVRARGARALFTEVWRYGQKRQREIRNGGGLPKVKLVAVAFLVSKLGVVHRCHMRPMLMEMMIDCRERVVSVYSLQH